MRITKIQFLLIEATEGDLELSYKAEIYFSEQIDLVFLIVNLMRNLILAMCVRHSIALILFSYALAK